MTKEKCLKTCSKLNYNYFGLQYGSVIYKFLYKILIIKISFFREQCFCGNMYGKYGKVDDNECSMVCKYDITTKCGNSHKNSVYEIL